MSIPVHLLIDAVDGRARLLCGFKQPPDEVHAFYAIRPASVTCTDCKDRMVRWDGRQTGLPSWTAYKVDAMTSPGRLIVIGKAGDLLAHPGDWLLDEGSTIAVLPTLQARGDA